MTVYARFPFVTPVESQSGLISMPYLPLSLSHGSTSISVSALIDSGSSVNVLAYEAGLALGLLWESQAIAVSLTGNLANFAAKGVVLTATIADFESVELAFAWTSAPIVPTLLGQVNFFEEFDICLSRSQFYIEVRPKL